MRFWSSVPLPRLLWLVHNTTTVVDDFRHKRMLVDRSVKTH